MRDPWSPLLAALAMLLAGSSVAASGFLVRFPVLEAQALRYAIAALILFIVAQCFRQLVLPALRHIILLVALGATGLAAFNVFVVLAIADADPSAVGVIIGGAPIVLTLAGPLLNRAQPSLRLVVAAAIVSVGAAVVEGVAGSTTPRGLLLSSGALACEVAFSVLAAPVLLRIGPIAVSLYACVAASALLALAALFTDVAVPDMTVSSVIVYQAIATPIAFVAWYVSIGRIGVARTGIFVGLMPVFAFLSGVLVGTGSFQMMRAIGTVLVCAGTALGLQNDSESRVAHPDQLASGFRAAR